MINRQYDVILIKTPTIYISTPNRSVAASFFQLNTSMGSLGLVMLASVLEKEGYNCHVFYPDCIQDIVGLVIKYKPKILGISTETMNAFQAYQIPSVLTNAGLDVFKVIGGYHASFEYQSSLQAGYDCVVIGEGEYTFLELVKAVLEHRSIQDIQGIVYNNQSGESIKTTPRPWIEDIDSLPLPNWSLSDLHLPSKLGIIYATRGCPIGCSFCVTSEYYGHRARFRSAESIVEEIERRNYRVVYFQDDDFTINLDRVKHLHDHFSKSKHMPIMVIYSRLDTIARHPEIATLLARMGVKLIYYGIESHHQTGLNYIHKKLRIEDQVSAINITNQANINIWASLMVLPNETITTWEETIEFIKKEAHPSIATVGICVPFPGTQLFTELTNQGRILHQNWNYYDGLHCIFQPDILTPSEIEDLMYFGDKTLNKNPLLRYSVSWLSSLPASIRYIAITTALTGKIPYLI